MCDEKLKKKIAGTLETKDVREKKMFAEIHTTAPRWIMVRSINIFFKSDGAHRQTDARKQFY